MSKDFNFYLTELQSNECQCGRGKKSGKSFCYICYNKLPKEMRNPLYQRIGDGYEEAYEDAVEYLDGL